MTQWESNPRLIPGRRVPELVGDGLERGRRH